MWLVTGETYTDLNKFFSFSVDWDYENGDLILLGLLPDGEEHTLSLLAHDEFEGRSSLKKFIQLLNEKLILVLQGDAKIINIDKLYVNYARKIKE